MHPILIYNWKTYIASEAEAVALLNALTIPNSVTAVICPSTIHLAALKEPATAKDIALGAQDISVSRETPQTGRQSGEQLRTAGVTYVLVGHAETRAQGVTNSMVAQKTAHALIEQITPVICLSEQEAGDTPVKQLQEIMKHTVDQPALTTAIIAYEPTEYIGAASALPVAEIKEQAEQLRSTAAAYGINRILYGGSVSPDNAAEILNGGGVDGFLLGRAGCNQKTANDIAGILM